MTRELKWSERGGLSLLSPRLPTSQAPQHHPPPPPPLPPAGHGKEQATERIIEHSTTTTTTNNNNNTTTTTTTTTIINIASKPDKLKDIIRNKAPHQREAMWTRN
ncbi:hypothetical protein E2C01_083370 [Portunus trituberculatus]|uniref:Uncharacterized protein n=1 Tax=Portunus trituberculatus TaxID=210409 RepID=A0A5B7J114_PORTR|nr:hypothetical protein [Portunus trituberculatus]